MSFISHSFICALSAKPKYPKLELHIWQSHYIGCDIKVWNLFLDQQINPNRPQHNKTQHGDERKSLITSYKRVSYGHEIAVQAVTPEWRAMGGQRIVVRDAPCSNLDPLFGGDSLKTKKGARGLE